MINIIIKKRSFIWVLAVAIILVSFLITIDSLNCKWYVFALIAMLSGLAIAPIKDKTNIFLLMFFFFQPTNLDTNFFFIPLINATAAGFSVSISDLLLVMLCIVRFSELTKHKLVVNKRFLVYMAIFMAYIGFSVLSICNAKIIALSVFELKKIIFSFVSIIIIVGSVNPKKVHWVIYVLLAGVLTQAIVGISQFILTENLGLEIFGESKDILMQSATGSRVTLTRVSGLMGHANAFATYLVLLIPIAMGVAISKVKPIVKSYAFLIACVAGLALIFTFSRGGLVGFGFAMSLFFLLSRKKLLQAENKVITILCVVFFITVMGFFWQDFMLRFFHSPSGQSLVRQYLNISALKMIGAHPFLGIGLNNFVIQLSAYDTAGVANMFCLPVHNIYLLIASESGVFSLMFFLLFIAFILTDCIFLFKKSKNSIVGGFALGLFCGILGMLMHNMVDYTMRSTATYQTFFAICGLLIVMRLNQRKGVINE